MALSKKHLTFIDEYFLHGMIGTDAYMAAYPKASYDTARANAAKLLASTSISAEINRRLSEKHMSAEEVLTRLADMARSDIADFARVGDAKSLEDLRGKTHVVKKFKRKIIKPKDKDSEPYEEIELELYDAQSALLNIGKQHGLFSDRHVVEMRLEKEIDGILDALEGILPPELYDRVLAVISGTEEGEGEVEAEAEDSE